MRADEAMLRFDAETRALWHLELLGCWTPQDAIAPFVPSMPSQDVEFDDDWDECDAFGWGPCNACRGTGARRHQWVF